MGVGGQLLSTSHESCKSGRCFGLWEDKVHELPQPSDICRRNSGGCQPASTGGVQCWTRACPCAGVFTPCRPTVSWTCFSQQQGKKGGLLFQYLSILMRTLRLTLAQGGPARKQSGQTSEPGHIGSAFSCFSLILNLKRFLFQHSVSACLCWARGTCIGCPPIVP